MDTIQEDEALRLVRHFRGAVRQCFQPAPRNAEDQLVSRFQHDYLVPNPPKDSNLAARLEQATTADIMNFGDYSMCQFHHDAAEMTLELVYDDAFLERSMGALLNFLDMQHPDGSISRAITPLKDHEQDPAKPVLCQMAARIIQRLEEQRKGSGAEWCREHYVYERLVRFISFHEKTYAGPHSLLKTHSALNSGYDNDPRLYGRPVNSISEPGHNSFMKLDYDALASIADAVGDEDADAWRKKSARLAALVNVLLWREANIENDRVLLHSGYYIALNWQHGVAGAAAAQREVIETPNWASFLPLYACIATQHQADIMIRHHLLDTKRYWSPQAGIRTMPADDPLFNQARRVLCYDAQEGKVTPVSNWCGPVWVLSNYYMCTALLNYGYAEEAQQLATINARLMLHNLDTDGCLYENYNDAKQGLWADQFCSWNVLTITMLRDTRLFPELSIASA